MFATDNREELVSAHADSRPDTRKRLLEHVRKRLDQSIARHVAMLVVYKLEPVHVNTHDRIVCRRLVEESENLLALGSIEKPRQRIHVGHRRKHIPLSLVLHQLEQVDEVAHHQGEHEQEGAKREPGHF